MKMLICCVLVTDIWLLNEFQASNCDQIASLQSIKFIECAQLTKYLTGCLCLKDQIKSKESTAELLLKVIQDLECFTFF